MKRKWILLKIISLFAVLIFLLAFTHNKYKIREVQEVRKMINYAQGHHFVTENLVDSLLKKAHPDFPKMEMKRVNPRDMEYLLNKDEFISYANVYLENNGVLHAEIQQQNPVLRVHDDTEQYYITDSGKKINLSEAFSAKVLIVEGDLENKEYKGLVELVKIINEDNLLKNLVVGIRKEKVNSFILLVDDGDYILELGKLENLETKLENFLVFHSEFIEKSAEIPYIKFNLRFNNQIVASK